MADAAVTVPPEISDLPRTPNNSNSHSRTSKSHQRNNKWQGPVIIAFLMVSILGTLALAATSAYLGVTLERTKDRLNAARHTDSCKSRPVELECINTPEEYLRILAERGRSHEVLNRTACVADNILGRMYTGAFKADDWQLDPVLSSNPARRIIFAIGPRMLEKILVWGHNAADKTVRSLGYGESFTCGSAPDWNSSCQYRLLVWTSECTVQNEGPLVRGDWVNLEAFMKEEYGKDLPPLTAQVSELESKTFNELTGCDPDVLAVKAYDPVQQQKAGCSPAYITALAKFPFAICNDTSPRYNRYTKCPAEEALLHSGKAPSALELRAFLQQTQGFLPQYTGYSYTANAYDEPLSQEYWIHNDVRANLARGTVARLWNDTAAAA